MKHQTISNSHSAMNFFLSSQATDLLTFNTNLRVIDLTRANFNLISFMLSPGPDETPTRPGTSSGDIKKPKEGGDTTETETIESN
ncbi:MAG: hypothetical protein QM669_02060 [Siphonobacter sp.]